MLLMTGAGFGVICVPAVLLVTGDGLGVICAPAVLLVVGLGFGFICGIWFSIYERGGPRRNRPGSGD